MHLRRTIVLLAVVGAALATPVPASAQEYPAPPTNVTVSSATVVPGEPVVFSATGGFISGESIEIDITYINGNNAARQGSAEKDTDGSGAGRVVMAVFPVRRAAAMITANAQGGFSTTIELTRAGTVVLTATGLQSGTTVSRTVTVVADSSDAGGDLPVTGSSGLRLALQVGAGATALFLGVLLVWLASDRRRRSATKA